MALPSNPFTEDRQQKLKDKSLEFLEAFGKNYTINFLTTFVNKLIAKSQGKDRDIRRLKYRSWTTVESPDPFRGYAYMKTGRGQGDFGGWSKYYFVEKKDYNIDVFANDKDFEKKKKPKSTINVAGYNVEANPTKFYQKEWDNLKKSMNAADEVTDDVKYSPYAWALRHPSKPHYVFQLHEGKNPACGGCLGGGAVEPEGAGKDKAEEMKDWVKCMKRCAAKVKGRDTKSVKGKGFTLTIKDMKRELTSLKKWDGGGTEPEIMVSMLVVHVVDAMMADILGDITGPFGMKVKMAYKISETVQSILVNMVDPAWKKMMEQVEELQKKIEPKLQEAMNKVMEVKNMVMGKIREKFIDKLGELLKKYVSPHLEKIMKIFEEPLAIGFDSVKKTFDTNAKDLPSDPKQMTATLDAVPRNPAKVKDVVKAANDLLSPLEALQKAAPDMFGYISTTRLTTSVEKLLLTTLDGAVFTLETKVKDKGAADINNQKLVVLADFEHDAVVCRNHFMREVMRDIILPPVKMAFTENSAFEGLNELIPAEVAEFLNIKGVVEDVVDLFVGEPIDSVVDGVYPLPPDDAAPTTNEA